MSKLIYIRIVNTILYTILVVFIGGGTLIIMHDMTWELSDDTMILMHLGVGEAMPINQPPVFNPHEGRFFPFAYQHFNILLPFMHIMHSGLEPYMAFCVNAVLWILFVLGFFYLSKILLREKTENDVLLNAIALALVLIVGQRTLYLFASLWTTMSIDFLCIIGILLCFWKYINTKYSKTWLLVFVAICTYYVFLLETNAVFPAVVGASALIGISKERNFLLGGSMCGIAMLFILLYACLIYPYIADVYDASHGSGVTFLGNIKSILLAQKLLFLVLAIFIWRLYRVFIIKDEYDNFSDALLTAGVISLMACFVMKLNDVLYYIHIILLAVPAFIKLLDFSTLRKRILSIIGIVLLLIYFIPKYSNLNLMWNERTNNKIMMIEFKEACLKHDNIVWFQDFNKQCQEDDWAYAHIENYLRYLGHSPLKGIDSIYHDNREALLIMPESHNLNQVHEMFNNESYIIGSIKCAPSIKYVTITHY